jgi:hypothetical protein
MTLPTPTNPPRDDNLLLWQYDFAGPPESSVSVEATDRASADVKMQAYLDAKNAPAPPSPPTAVEIALGLVQAVTTATDFAEAQTNLAAAAAALPPV